MTTASDSFLVALTRFSPRASLDAELPWFAPIVGLSLYEARLKLAAPLPWVVRSGLALEAAQALLGELRGREHGAVACPVSRVPSAERLRTPRSFQLTRTAFSGIDQHGREFSLVLSDLLGVVRAVELQAETRTVATKERKFAMGRALLTGGVMLNKQVERVTTESSTERQDVAYVFGRAQTEPLLLKEHLLNFEGLGEARAATAHASFESLLARLRNGAPQAVYDDRLMARKRRVDITDVRGLAKERTVESSNGPANALAAYLLMLGHLQQQL